MPTPLPPKPTPIRQWIQSADLGRVIDWREVIRPRMLLGLMNFSGQAHMVSSVGEQISVGPGDLIWLQTGGSALISAQRLPGSSHDCLLLAYPNPWLESTLAGMEKHMQAEMASLVSAPWRSGHVRRPLTGADRTWAMGLMAPHLCAQAQQLLDASRLLEFLLREVFPQPGEPPLSRTARISRDRVERVKAAMLQCLDQPPDLESLAKLADCSPHYLSRIFSEVEGKSLQLWLRAVRIDKAASLIASGQCNVSEAAIEVGYRSFSHFTKAFRSEKGSTPSIWLRNLLNQEQP